MSGGRIEGHHHPHPHYHHAPDTTGDGAVASAPATSEGPESAPSTPEGRLIGQVAEHQIRVRVPTQKGGSRILTPADLARIAHNPGLLESEFKATLTATELADQLEGASAWAQGRTIDLVAGARFSPVDGVDGAAAPAALARSNTELTVGSDGAFQISGAGINAAFTSFWQKLADFLLELISLSLADTRTFNGIIDSDEWRGRAACLAAAGEPELRALVTDPNQSHAVITRLTQAAQLANPDISGSEARSIGQALYQHLTDVYAHVPEARMAHLRPLLLDPSTPEATRELVGKVLTSDTFSVMSRGQQVRLMRVITGPDVHFCQPIRDAIQQLMSSQEYQALSPEDRAEAISVLLQSWPPNSSSASVIDASFDSRRAQFAIRGPTPVEAVSFASGEAPGLRYIVTIGGQDVPVMLPAEPNAEAGHFHTIEEVARGLAALSPALRAEITEVQVNPNPNPNDDFWAQRYGNPEFRSYMTAGADGIVGIYPCRYPQPQGNLDGSMIHEVGHVVSQRAFGSPSDPRWQQWQRAMEADPVAASGYARSSQGEDFAEFLQLYETVRGTPDEPHMRRLFPNRYRVLDQVLAARRRR